MPIDQYTKQIHGIPPPALFHRARRGAAFRPRSPAAGHDAAAAVHDHPAARSRRGRAPVRAQQPRRGAHRGRAGLSAARAGAAGAGGAGRTRGARRGAGAGGATADWLCRHRALPRPAAGAARVRRRAPEAAPGAARTQQQRAAGGAGARPAGPGLRAHHAGARRLLADPGVQPAFHGLPAGRSPDGEEAQAALAGAERGVLRHRHARGLARLPRPHPRRLRRRGVRARAGLRAAALAERGVGHRAGSGRGAGARGAAAGRAAGRDVPAAGAAAGALRHALPLAHRARPVGAGRVPGGGPARGRTRVRV